MLFLLEFFSVLVKYLLSESLSPDQEILSKIFAGVNIYFNYTGTAKCLQLADPDQIGSSMWDYQVSHFLI